jgi:hypothetical protein
MRERLSALAPETLEIFDDSREHAGTRAPRKAAGISSL